MRQRLFRIILSLAFSMMTVVTGMASEPGQGTETDKKVLTVGLFRYVPDIKAFETALTAQWKNIEPDVTLRFVDWDCYFEEPKSDVFVFDGLYAPQYIEKGLLYPLGETIPARSAYPDWTLEQGVLSGNVLRHPADGLHGYAVLPQRGSCRIPCPDDATAL